MRKQPSERVMGTNVKLVWLTRLSYHLPLEPQPTAYDLYVHIRDEMMP